MQLHYTGGLHYNRLVRRLLCVRVVGDSFMLHELRLQLDNNVCRVVYLYTKL